MDLKSRFFWISLLLIALLGYAGLSGCTLTPTGFRIQSNSPGVVADYLLKVSESFGIKAVDTEHQEGVDEQVQGFEDDLANGFVDEYYKNPGFSILLAAGSEGNFFNSPEGIEAIGKSGAVFARALVFDPGAAPKSFKGQFSNGRFYFAGANQAVFSPLNTAYLITLNLNLDTHVFKGQLVAGSEGNFIRPGAGLPAELVAGSEGNFLREPNTDQLRAHLEKYQSALSRHSDQGETFARQVSELKFVPPAFPLGLAWTETFARLMRAYPDEMTFTLGRIRGLPRGQLDEAWRELMERYVVRWTEDCGASPPDSGKIWPQRLAEVTAIPQGWQTEALDKVIAEIPDFDAELAELLKKPMPERQGVFEPMLNKYQQSHPEVFARHQWRDEFAPPDCVKPRRMARPSAPPGPTAGPPPSPPSEPRPQ